MDASGLGNCAKDRKYDPSLPLAFRIAAVFECRIEDVFVAPKP